MLYVLKKFCHSAVGDSSLGRCAVDLLSSGAASGCVVYLILAADWCSRFDVCWSPIGVAGLWELRVAHLKLGWVGGVTGGRYLFGCSRVRFCVPSVLLLLGGRAIFYGDLSGG